MIRMMPTPILINAYCTLRALPAQDFPHDLHGRRDRSDPDLPTHLDGFASYVVSRGGGEMTQQAYHVMQHLSRTRHHLSVTIDQPHLGAFGDRAERANAICFLPDGSVRGPRGQLLIDATGGTSASGAHPPHPADAVARKGRSEKRLRSHGIAIAEALPPVAAESEVELRRPDEVAARALGLFAVALRATSLLEGQGIPVADLRERIPGGFDRLSPAEEAFLADPAPDAEAQTTFVWRYEALAVPLWALGVAPDLVPPPAGCDVPWIVQTLLGIDGGEFVARSALLPAADVLDVTSGRGARLGRRRRLGGQRQDYARRAA
jgi:hypothetical protein